MACEFRPGEIQFLTTAVFCGRVAREPFGEWGYRNKILSGRKKAQRERKTEGRPSVARLSLAGGPDRAEEGEINHR